MGNIAIRPRRLRVFISIQAGFLLISLFIIAGCEYKSPDFPKPSPPTPEEKLIAQGRDIFFDEIFGGNGRTCSTCHRAEANFTIGPKFISALPSNDPLFVAEFNPSLSKNFEKPESMHFSGLILENLDGFQDLENVFVLRGSLPTLALRTSIASSEGPRRVGLVMAHLGTVR